MPSLKEKLSSLVGREVIIEGTFPIPIGADRSGRPQIAFASTRGKLVELYDDGFGAVVGDNPEPTAFVLANVRSVTPISEIARVMKPGILT